MRRYFRYQFKECPNVTKRILQNILELQKFLLQKEIEETFFWIGEAKGVHSLTYKGFKDLDKNLIMILASGKPTMVLLDYFYNQLKNIETETKPLEIIQEGKTTQQSHIQGAPAPTQRCVYFKARQDDHCSLLGFTLSRSTQM